MSKLNSVYDVINDFIIPKLGEIARSTDHFGLSKHVSVFIPKRGFQITAEGDEFWRIAVRHQLLLTVGWVGGPESYEATWFVSTQASGPIAAGSFWASSDAVEAMENLHFSLADRGFEMGSNIGRNIGTYTVHHLGIPK